MKCSGVRRMNQQQSTLKDLEAFLRDLEFRTSERSFPKSETFKINGCLQELKVTLPLRLCMSFYGSGWVIWEDF